MHLDAKSKKSKCCGIPLPKCKIKCLASLESFLLFPDFTNWAIWWPQVCPDFSSKSAKSEWRESNDVKVAWFPLMQTFPKSFIRILTRMKMLFRSKTAIKVHFQKLFNTKDSSKSFHNYSISIFNWITSVETQKLSAIITMLSNNYNTEQNNEILSINKQSQQCLQSIRESSLSSTATAPRHLAAKSSTNSKGRLNSHS